MAAAFIKDAAQWSVRTAALCAAVLAGLVAAFIALHLLVLSTTDDARLMRVIAAAVQNGDLTTTNFPRSFYGRDGLDYDMFGECIALSTNLGNADKPLLYRAAATPFHGFEGSEPCKGLIDDVKRGTVETQLEYYRYWHGPTLYLRTMLSWFALPNVRVINALLIIGALSFLTVLLVRHFGGLAAPFVVVPLAAASNLLTAPASTVHALTWAWAFLSIALVFRRVGDILAPRSVAMVFALGCIANFFDDLYSPTIAPTFMAFLVIAVGLRTKTIGRTLGEAVVTVGAWFAGFLLSWICRWLFAASVLGWAQVSGNILISVRQRTFGDSSLADVPKPLFTATRTVFETLKSGSDQMIENTIVAAVILLIIILIATRRWAYTLPRAAALLSPLLLPVVWVEIARDHTLIHPMFAYRQFVYFAIIPLMTVLCFWPWGPFRNPNRLS